MLLCVPGIDGLGQYAGKAQRFAQVSMLDYLAQPWRKMIQEGRITQVVTVVSMWYSLGVFNSNYKLGQYNRMSNKYSYCQEHMTEVLSSYCCPDPNRFKVRSQWTWQIFRDILRYIRYGVCYTCNSPLHKIHGLSMHCLVNANLTKVNYSPSWALCFCATLDHWAGLHIYHDQLAVG